MGCGSTSVWYGRPTLLRAGSRARCDASSAPSVTIDSLPSGATSASFAYQSVSEALDDATRCSAIGPAVTRGLLSTGPRDVRPWGPSSRWSSGTYGVAATVPYLSNAMLKPAAGSVM